MFVVQHSHRQPSVLQPSQTGALLPNTRRLEATNHAIPSTQATPLQSTIIAALLGLLLGPIDALIGINCSPISVIGVGGNSCNANPVCCTNSAVVGSSSFCRGIDLFLLLYLCDSGRYRQPRLRSHQSWSLVRPFIGIGSVSVTFAAYYPRAGFATPLLNVWNSLASDDFSAGLTYLCLRKMLELYY